MQNRVTWATSVVVLIGMLWAGMMATDNRYARAADTQRKFDALQALYLQQQVSTLERDEFELRREASRRRLTAIEEQRLESVRRQLQQLRPQLKLVEPQMIR